MKYNVTINRSSFGLGDGALEINGREFIFYKKSAITRALFGAIGTALASGKEALRFTVDKVQSYNLVEKTFSRQLTIQLQDGRFVTFTLKKDVEAEVMPLLKANVTQE